MTSLTARSRSIRGALPVGIVAGLLMGIAFVVRDGIGLRLPLLVMAMVGGLQLLLRPEWGPVALILAAVAVPLAIGTGTEVSLNAATLLVPVLAGLWLLRGTLHGQIVWRSSPVDRPWLLLLAAGLVSLAIGRATWDLGVPVNSRFVLVQIAQWAIFFFAALAYWAPGMLLRSARHLQLMTWAFLWLGGGLAVLRLVPGVGGLVAQFETVVFTRAPFLALLAAVAGGQLFFNSGLGVGRRLYLLALLATVIYQSTFEGRLSISEWTGVWAVLAVLVWERFPRLRWLAVTAMAFTLLAGTLFPSLYSFAGGDARWSESGGSRLVLMERVLDVTGRNPLTGLGPAAYRPYTSLEPLPYGNALWFYPQISSHNNYVDIYAHFGLVGLGLFGWLAVTLWRYAVTVARSQADGFRRGYASGMVALWVGILIIMALADWAFPFVYNIGYDGFQASILVWLFLGGLSVLQQGERSTMTEPTPVALGTAPYV